MDDEIGLCRFCGQYIGHGCMCYLEHGPAPKEEGMPYDPNCQCMNCKDETKRRMLDPYDPNVNIEDLRAESASRAHAANISAALRAHYDAVYMAEVGSGSGLGTAHTNALESVRTHAARMAELEAVITEDLAI